MPTYEADLRWLKTVHPDQYSKIPQEILTNEEFGQQHMSFYPDGPEGPEIWVIGFYRKEESDTESADVFVELDIERPPADDVGGRCQFHTLKVSREYCPACHQSDNVVSN